MAATEQPIVQTTEFSAALVVEEVPAETKKATKAKKSKNSPTHAPYIEMVTEAITTLKERNGSSQYAIQKFVEEKHKNLPSNFRKLLLASLRKFVASGRLVKVKGSFKLSAAPKTSAAKPKKAAVAAKPKAKVVAAKPKTKLKAKAAAVKPKAKAVAGVKPKAKAVAAKPAAKGTKRKAVAKVKPVAKVAKTAAKSTPSRKAVAALAKKSAAKSVKAKSVKSPAKRSMPKRGRK